MPPRFVLLPPDDQLGSSAAETGRVAMARVALRAVPERAAMAATRTVAVAPMLGLSAADLASAEERGPPLRSLNCLRRLPGSDGAMLLEIGDEDRLALRREYPGAQLVAEGTARMAFVSPEVQELAAMTGVTGARAKRLEVRVRDAKNQKPLSRAEVCCIFDPRAKPPIGAKVLTDSKGKATLLVPSQFRATDIYVIPRNSAWPVARMAFVLRSRKNSLEFDCPKIADSGDCARALYDQIELDAGKNVVVAVVDGGAGPHDSLVIGRGTNVVDGESPDDFQDNGIGHGSHVAGLIAARPRGPMAGGFSPGVTLRVYRAYPKNDFNTGSFAIAEAIRAAVDDGADLINLSTTLLRDQPEIGREVNRARASGTAIIAAAGNEGAEVLFPARLSGVLAVSAMGILGCGAAGSSADLACRKKPKGLNPKHRVADFTCSGPEIDLIAPGVCLVSLYPHNKLSVMSGTSMAAPVVTARIARALAANAALLNQARTLSRSDAINRMALRGAKNVGFSANLQGQGLPR